MDAKISSSEKGWIIIISMQSKRSGRSTFKWTASWFRQEYKTPSSWGRWNQHEWQMSACTVWFFLTKLWLHFFFICIYCSFVKCYFALLIVRKYEGKLQRQRCCFGTAESLDEQTPTSCCGRVPGWLPRYNLPLKKGWKYTGHLWRKIFILMTQPLHIYIPLGFFTNWHHCNLIKFWGAAAEMPPSTRKWRRYMKVS